MSNPDSPQSFKDAKPGGETKALELGELMQRLDEAVAKSIEDYSELFVTNAKEHRSVLEDCRDYIDKLCRENADMVETFRRRDEEAFALQEMQTEEISEKKARIDELEVELAQKVVDIDGHDKIEMRKIIEAERLKRRQLQIKFGARVEELLNRLESVTSFIQRQEEVEARLEAAEKETEETRAQMADLAPGFERKYIEKCLVFKEEVDKKLEGFMFKVKEEIGNRVGDRVKQVLAQNEILLSEIQIHSSSTTGLQEDADRLKAENRKLRAEIDLHGQAEDLHLKRSRHQRQVIRSNDCKIQNLEKSLQQVTCQFSEERRILQEKHAYIVAELKSDNAKLKSVVLQKAKELKKFRHLAEIVIRQRGEVELFLLDSIQYVKNQICLARNIQINQSNAADKADTPSPNLSHANCPSTDSSTNMTSSLPPIHRAPASWPGAGAWPRGKNTNLQQQSNGGINEVNSLAGNIDVTEAQADTQINFLDGSHDPFTVPVILPMIDISNLSWEDREKVLRYLYKKINTARNNQSQAEHSKRTQDVATDVDPEKFQGYASEAERTVV